MMGKTILCHCEDVTLDELLSAIDQGYTDIETIKRYTGIATGKCQGKCCLVQLIRVLDGMGMKSEARLTTIRQPVVPLPIGDIAAGADSGDPPGEDEERRDDA